MSTAEPPVSTIVVARDSQTRTIVSLDGSRSAAPFSQDLIDLVTNAVTVLVDVHHLDLATGLAAAAKRAGVPVVLDAGRWKPGHGELLPLVDVVICSEAFLPPGVPSAPNAVIDHIHSLGPTHAAITRGSSPIRFSGPAGHGEIAIEPIDTVADTLGAGDILHGAFCHYHGIGQPFEVALRNASAVATLSCRSFGTRQWMKSALAAQLAP
jgi:sugar/nucleoside kinase (ribokinase family)